MDSLHIPFRRDFSRTKKLFFIAMLPIAVLIFIGDRIRWILWTLFLLILRSYKTLHYVLYSFIASVKNYCYRVQESATKKKNSLKNFHISVAQIVRLVWNKRIHIEPRVSFSLPKFHIALPTRAKKQTNIHINHAQSFVIGIGFTIIFIFLPYNAYTWLRTLPNPQLLNERNIEVSTKILDRNGIQLYEIYADENRTPIPLSQMPTSVINATIAIEDKSFYIHPGISLSGIIRSLRETIIHRRVQGGSTITQQLIKSALLTPDITLSRKIKEIILAFWTERLYSKSEILEMYLNQIPYGHTAWGIEAASQTYFGKPAKELILAEAALLAGLPAAPTQYSPFGSHPEETLQRQAEVLRRMREDHYITRAEEQNALETPVRVVSPKIGIMAPHFVMYVKDILEKRYGVRMVEKGGLRVVTSLDASIQQKTEDIVSTNIESLKKLRVGNGAAVITNPQTGEILAMVGSKDYFNIKDEGNVNVTTRLRQPGSSIKVVNYATALENGFTAASVLIDAPVVYNTPGSPPYAPGNYDGTFHGAVPLRYALGNSYNIPAVKTLAQIGVPAMIDKGKLMGITSWDDSSQFGLSLTLGGGATKLIDLAKVFGTLSNNGKRIDLHPILKVTDYTGKVLEKYYPGNGVMAVKPEVAWIMSNILSDNNARMNAFGPASSLVIPGKTVSVKTGTSNDKRDNLTIGYTPSYVVAVWVGNNDNSPMDPLLTSGVTGAAPIWHDIMTELLKNKPDETQPKPDSVIAIPCYYGRVEYFVKGTQPVGGQCAPLPTPSPTPTPAP